jgi:hypothetical protein
VKRRKTCDDQEEARVLQLKKERGRIKRSKILETPLTGGTLRRECGQNRGFLDGPAIVAGGLVKRGYISPQILNGPAPWRSSDYLFNVNQRPNIEDSIIDVQIGKELCKVLILINCVLARNDGILMFRTNSENEGQMTPDERHSTYYERFGTDGPTTSLAVHTTERLVALTWYSSFSDSGIAITNLLGDLREQEIVGMYSLFWVMI